MKERNNKQNRHTFNLIQLEISFFLNDGEYSSLDSLILNFVISKLGCPKNICHSRCSTDWFTPCLPSLTVYPMFTLN